MGHRAHRLAHALLDAEAAVADPAERSELGTPARDLTDVHRSRSKLADAAGDRPPVEGAHAAGERIRGGVGRRDRLVEIGDADDRRHRAERLAGHELGLGRNVVEHRGRRAALRRARRRAAGSRRRPQRPEPDQRLPSPHARSITVPTSVDSSSGSPTRSCAAPAETRSASSSATESTAMIRLTAVQRCPEFANAPRTASPAASCRSASPSTISGSLPPSSSTARRYPRRAAIDLPTATPPVNDTTSTASCPQEGVQDLGRIAAYDLRRSLEADRPRGPSRSGASATERRASRKA